MVQERNITTNQFYFVQSFGFYVGMSIWWFPEIGIPYLIIHLNHLNRDFLENKHS